MEKTYTPHSIEQRWYQTWEENGYFKPQGGENPYCIMIPPPNVTGSLHMGHAFQDTIMDTLIRFHRMKGDNTLWQPGSDHAGIATQMVVERQLNAEGVTRHELGRDKFIERIWEWKNKSGNTITQQLRRMGTSPDWSRERFTMDDGLSEAVKEVFVRLHGEGLIYRGKRLVNWDPVLHTAVSDLEVLNEEESGYMWHMRYPLADGSGHLVVATTRPETMLGDAAVAIHPGDERYQHLVGQMVKLPLSNRLIPIIADDYVDPEFGTGCVKITPAHDFNDYGVWSNHRNENCIANQPNGGLINIFTIDAAIIAKDDELGELIPDDFHGLDRFEARKLVLEELGAQGLLEKTDDHKLMVPRGDRSGTIIEPFLTDQWYVKVDALAKPAIEAVENGDIKFVPDNWKNTYFEWMRNIEDWCISRQIWWGHRIPAWYDDSGAIYVGRSEQEVRDKHQLSDNIALKQDEDVLDTWFSSALWTFSTLGWPNKTPDLATFHPTSVLVTGFDIIFFWVARMIMMGLKFTGEVPFKEIYIHGLVRDSQGQKMSKSKGNVLDPIDIIDGIDLESLVRKRTSGLMKPKEAAKIEKATRKEFADGIPAFGTDAMRFTFAAQASTGRDINFDMNRIEGYRNFCNKLWNASRFVMMNLEGHEIQGDRQRSSADQWILSRLNQVIANVTRNIEEYRFDHAAQNIYEFVWNEYCDWYLELTKPILNGDSSEAAKRGTRHTLIQVLENILRLAHPIIPFITEEIWQRVAPMAGVSGQTIMLQSYPVADKSLIDDAAEEEIQWVMAFIIGIRKIRSGMNIAPSKPLPVLIQNGSAADKARLQSNQDFLTILAKTESITWLSDTDQAPESATSLVGEMKLLVPMAGLIDKDAELKRLNKQIEKLQKQIKGAQGKLANPGFTDKAPAAVVQKERDNLGDIEGQLTQLKEQHIKIMAI